MNSGFPIDTELFEQTVFPTGLAGLVQFESEVREDVSPHWHSGVEILLCEEGTGVFRVNGEQKRLTCGDLLLISPYQVHSSEPFDEPFAATSIIFNDAVMRDTLPRIDRYIYSLDSASEQARSQLIQLINKARDYQKQHSQVANLLVNSILYEIAFLLIQHFACGMRSPEGTKNDSFIAMRAIGYIDKHHRESITGEAVASEFGYSREYFSRTFKRLTGYSFKEFLTKVRLADAVNRMWVSKDSLSDIAIKSGFPDLRSFSKTFISAYGFSPKDYQQFLNKGTKPHRLIDEVNV